MSSDDHLATARDAAQLLTNMRTAALATLEAATGHPYVSMVAFAVGARGRPVLLLSQLARHTQNLRADPRASLLVHGPAGAGHDDRDSDPMAQGRVTLIGRIEADSDPEARGRYLERHSEAQVYAGFADFAVYALVVERVHFIGGFGRIVDVPPAALAQALG